jgi:hypothetical protein
MRSGDHHCPTDTSVDRTIGETGSEIAQPSPTAASNITHRPCSWCDAPIAVERRAGRPRLYCAASCRQRAYEHRHGFLHVRTARPLPGQSGNDRWSGTGYERGGPALLASRAHALRPAARPQGHRRETLCGLLALPLPGQHFKVRHPQACESCVQITHRHPLQFGINTGAELARLRSVIVDVAERRVSPTEAVRWIENSVPSGSTDVVVPDRLGRRVVDARPAGGKGRALHDR